MMADPGGALPLYDALIIGAGPAGATLARQLGLGGWRIALVDREPRGRDRVCGGFLGPEIRGVWRELGLERHLASLPAAPVGSLMLSGTSGACVDMPLPDGGGFGVSRGDLDQWLGDRAIEAGAHLWTATQVRRLRRASHMTRITLERDGARQEIVARLLIRAVGRRTAAHRVPQAEPHFGCKTVYDGMAGLGRRVSLHFVRGGHVGFNRLPDGRATMCLYVGRARLRDTQGRLDAMMARLSEENPAIGRLLTGARRAGPWLSCPAQPDAQAIVCHQGAFNGGDAVAMLNPVLGAGLSVAMASSVLLARELLAARPQDLDRDRVARRYARAWRAEFAGRARLGRWLGWCEEHPAVSERLLRLFSKHPAICGRVVRSTRPSGGECAIMAACGA
jgi:flavin-dependent dehydrogenase